MNADLLKYPFAGLTSAMQFSSPNERIAKIGADYFRNQHLANDWEPVCYWRLKEYKPQITVVKGFHGH